MSAPGGPAEPILLRLRPDDMVAAGRLHQLAAIGSRATLGAAIALSLCAFGFGYAVVAGPGEEPRIVGAFFGGGMFVALYAVMLFNRMVLMPSTVRNGFREQKNLQEDHALSWDAERCTVVGRTSRSEIPWHDYLKWQENRHVLLLYLSSGFYQVLPKRILSQEAVTQIRGHLADAGVPKGRLLLA